MVDFNEYHNNLIAIFDPFQEPKFFSPMPNATDFMGSIDLFSYEMANLYLSTVAPASGVFTNTAGGNLLMPYISVIQRAVGVPILTLALSSILKNLYTNCKTITYKDCIPIGAAFVGIWSPGLIPGAYMPLPAHPPSSVIPTPGILQLDPGFISVFTIAAAWYASMIIGTDERFRYIPTQFINSTLIRVAMELHFRLDIKGLYIGITPAIPPIPTVLPWFGLH